ncbi:uncharacterized protein DNG_10224 [Cephalotrichum gorgonifer]|uniref:Nucleoside phosphorylase domain-containing protein n=1 Tax=Cephalotrichum gorgonifer TaxID=2041049 RepID=A0AAE8T032_9PEZI|nr:uncharacterized protein DNG_10224 [Cephalotrichum gorgonifer]
MATPNSPPADRNEFQVAIVCALPLEYDALSLLIDRYWDENGDRYGRAPGDENTYTTGRIGNFDIVVVLLPGMGKVSAAGATAGLRSSFPGLRLVLLIGVCGGVPRPGTDNEMLLGDVVISKTVVQYDLGRLYPNDFAAKDTIEHTLGRPTKNIRNMVSILETRRARERLENLAARYLEQIQARSAEKLRGANYQYPGAGADLLFKASYRHKHQHLSAQCICAECYESSAPVCQGALKAPCDELGCDDRYVVERDRVERKRKLERQGRWKEAQTPSIFVGRIGSGDTVLMSGEDRDRIATRHDLLAFEMESAGAWDEVPCIVIKGVCDYADSHKNKRWQDFAAATAASITKALLECYVHTDRPSIACPSTVAPGGASPRSRSALINGGKDRSPRYEDDDGGHRETGRARKSIICYKCASITRSQCTVADCSR